MVSGRLAITLKSGSGVPEVAPASGGAGLGAGDPTNGHKARI